MIFIIVEIGKKIAAGILPICAKTGRVLIIRRGLHQPKPGLWACFGGKFEVGLDKNPKETAQREFAEESKFTGTYKISKFPLYINKDNHSFFYTYIGIFPEEFTPDLQSGNEAIDYGWFSLGETPEALLPGFQEALEKKHKTLQNIICFYSGKC